MSSGLRKDDRVLSETRWAAAVMVALLLPALVIPWGFPGRTHTLWAWTMKSQMTPVFMGSAYGAGAYFFARVVLAGRWHTVSAGVLSAAIFAGVLLVVTAVHFGSLNHGHAPFVGAAAFYGWSVVAVVAPFIVAWLWVRNQRTDSGMREPGDPLVPEWVRRLARIVSAASIIAGLLCLLAPAVANDLWPWRLTPLTAGVLGAFTIEVGVGALLLSLDERWSSWRIPLETFLVATALLLVGTARVWGTLDHSNAGSWLFVASLIALAVAAALLFRMMEIRSRLAAAA